METKNIYSKLQTVRCELQKLNLKKTGLNKFAGFHYYQLEDILPSINELCLKYGLFTQFTTTIGVEKQAILTVSSSDEGVSFSIPFCQPEIKGANAVQQLGGAITYLRRYLFIAAFEITESDTFDAVIGKEPAPSPKTTLLKGNLTEALARINKANPAQLTTIIEMIKCRTWTEDEKCTLNDAIDRVEEFFNKPNEQTDIPF
jgi:hypothetical protein